MLRPFQRARLMIILDDKNEKPGCRNSRLSDCTFKGRVYEDEVLRAKPIIDLDVVMESYDVFPEIVQRLGEHGYEHEGNFV